MQRLRWIVVLVLLSGRAASAQSPEVSLREFASGQIKKGVRSIGFGGDGATWGNYGLVYREHDTAVVDAGVTAFTNGNTFAFTAVGVTSPPLWRGLAIYVLGPRYFLTRAWQVGFARGFWRQVCATITVAPTGSHW